MKFRTKPREVEAMRWSGSNFDKLNEFTNAIELECDFFGEHITLRTAESEVRVGPGDWIVKDGEGIHAVKAGIFELVYEEAK